MNNNKFSLVLLCLLFSVNFSFGQIIEKKAADKIVPGSRLIRQDDKTKGIKYILLESSTNIPSVKQSEWLHKSLKLTNNHSLKELKPEIDNQGFKHTKYQFQYKNIPIEGYVYSVHSKDNKIHSANGEFNVGKDINTKPQLSAEEAFDIAIKFINSKKYNWDDGNDPKPIGELVILPINNEYKLSYKLDIYSIEPLSRNYIYIDAATGKILKTIDRIHIYDTSGSAKTMYNGNVTITTDSYNGYYRLRETGRGNGIETYNLNRTTSYTNATDFFDSDNIWNDSLNFNLAANDAHFGAEATYDYFNTRFGRNSFDNNGAIIKSYVHYSTNYANAFWDGTKMTYGDGDGIDYLPLTAIEVVSHEITHAITQYTADLEYLNESGALNESFSDIFAIVIDFIKNPGTANYLMGDAISITKTPFRSMENPNDYGDPDTYQGLYWKTGSADNGGVHSNSGVQNFWFYLLCEGGSGTNDLGKSYHVRGIGREKAAQIAYKTLVYYLTQFSNYSDARFYSIQAAIDLFGDCSSEVAAVTDAWYAVGVGEPFTTNIIADFNTSKNTACSLPATISFYNTSIRANGYKWNFGDGNTDTIKNPIHTFLNEGTYNIKLITTGIAECNNSDTIEKQIIINSEISAAETNCIPKILFPGYGGFKEFKIHNYLKILGSTSTNYIDNICTDSVSLTEGKYYPLNIKFRTKNPENIYIWVDLNNNGNLNDPGELIYLKKNVVSLSTDSLIFPGNALKNTPLRLRIATDYSSNPILDACSNSINGQIMDFRVIINQNVDAPVALFKSIKNDCISGDSIQFLCQSINLPETWNWYFEGGTPSASASKNPVVHYNYPGIYKVSLKVANKYGVDSITIEGGVTVTTPAPAGLNAKITNRAKGIVSLAWNNGTSTDIYENFDNQPDDLIYSDNNIYSISNGYLNAAGTGSGKWYSALYNKECSDFILEYKFQTLITQTTSIGTFIRADEFLNQTTAKGYFIAVIPDGEYSVWKLSQGTATNIIPWTVTSAINTTYQGWNIVTIQAIGNNFTISINGIYVDEFQDNSFPTGKINLVHYASSGTSFDIRYDYLNILNTSNPIKIEGLNKAINKPFSGISDITTPPALSSIQNNVPAISVLESFENKNVFNFYKVYRDSNYLGKTTNTAFTDTLPEYGTYNYVVVAKYDSSELEALSSASINWGQPNPGEICETAQNLKNIANPFSGSTFGYFSDFQFCNMGKAPDRIFYIDIPSKYAISIGQTYNDFDSREALRIGSSCPGDIEIICSDEPDIITHKYTNSSDSTQRLYYIISSSSSYGNFTLSWKLDPPKKLIPEFTASKTFINKGETVYFTDKTTGVPTSLKWYFDGGNPSTSTISNPSVYYPIAGEYDVKLVVSNHLGKDSIVKTKHIVVNNLNYCNINLGGQGYCPGNIKKISISGTNFNNSSHNGCSTENNSTYGIYPPNGTLTTSLDADSTYNFIISTTTYTKISVWIDYNQNSIFESNEWTLLNSYTTPNTEFSVNITIPSSAKNGKTGMRFRTSSTSAIHESVDACTYFSSGITEDYFITINNQPKIPTADFTAPQEIMYGKTITYTDQSKGLPDNWKWSFEGGIPSESTLQNPVVKYNNAGIYDVKLVVNNSLGTDSIIKTDFITVYSTYPGENCSSAQNLAYLTSPYKGSTISYSVDFNFCSNSPDRIFYIDVPTGNNLNIGQRYNDFDSKHTIRIGDACPGSETLLCKDDPDTEIYTYNNNTGKTQRIYYIIGGFSQDIGTFELTWELIKPSKPTANFSTTDTLITANYYAYFYDNSKGYPTSRTWEFPGGSPSISTYSDPSIKYSTPGTYDVKLVVSNALGNDTLIKKNYIKVLPPPKPVANFYANYTNLIAGDDTYFSSQSTNNPTSYRWTFYGGSPSSSTSSSLYVYYNTPGIYSVKLVVSNSGGSDSITKINYIIVTAPPKPIANFYTYNTNLIAGSGTQFYNNSSNSPISYKWVFNGGTPALSTSSNPYVTYNVPGTYDVKLIATNAGGSDSLIKSNYITVTTLPKPVASFNYNNNNILVGNYVYFSDNSSNSPTSRKWVFEGGSPSTSTNSYAYVYYYTPGKYDVKLVVSNSGGSDSLIREELITVTLPPKPIANFSASTNNAPAGSTISFNNYSTNNPTSYKWTFTGGSPETSSYTNPSVTYNTPGIYDVKLIVENGGGSDTLIRKGYIVITNLPKPIANFYASSTTITSGSYTYFYDNSANYPSNWQWTFTGGSPSTYYGRYPSSVYYYKSGSYPVSLKVTNATGSDSLIRNGYITVTPPPKPVASFYYNSYGTTPGSTYSFYDNSTNSPTTRKWTFTGGSPETSTAYSQSVTYNNYGSYDVKLVVSNEGGIDSITKAGVVNISKYCTSYLGGSNGCPGDISSVEIKGTSLKNQIHNKCNVANSSTMGIYPAKGNTTATLYKGKSYELSVTTTNTDVISVWIDFNQNGTFEYTEWTSVASLSTPNSPNVVGINIPSYALNGLTGMRIRSCYTGYSNGAYDACTYFNSGITEDYYINIADSMINFTADTTTICLNNNVTFTNKSKTIVNTCYWDFGLGSSPRTSTAIGPHKVTYSTTGYKTVTFIINGTDSVIKTDYIYVKALPTKPVITQSSNNLISNVVLGNQWYQTGIGIIGGATNYIYAPSTNGYYYTIVTNNGCSSLASNTIYFIRTSLNNTEKNGETKLYPNPTTGLIYITTDETIEKIEIKSIIGTLVKTLIPNSNAKIENVIDISDVSNGYYDLIIYSKTNYQIFKIVKTE